MVIIPISDPESIFELGEYTHAKVWDTDARPVLCDEEEVEFPSFLDLENFAADSGLFSDRPTLVPLGRRVPAFSPAILEAFGGPHAGAPVKHTNPDLKPPPDALGFHAPFHFFYRDNGGIYLLLEGIIGLAEFIIDRSGGRVLPREAMQAARMFIYYHEAFHHKTECFATRLELAHRTPFYKTSFVKHYLDTANTDACLEEGLANASALDNSERKVKGKKVKRYTPAALQALQEFVQESPPGYRLGVAIADDFMNVRC